MTEPVVRVAFVGGLGRSGSTLLELLLASQGDFCSVGETVHLWRRGVLDNERCSCGLQFADCDFWRAVGQRAFGGWEEGHAEAVIEQQRAVDRTRHVPLSLMAAPASKRGSAMQRYGQNYHAIYQAAAAESGLPIILDSSKHVSLATVLARTRGIDLRIVHVVRDPRAVAHSWSRNVDRPEADGKAQMATASPTRIAGRWTLQNGLLELVSYRASVYLMTYEDLVKNPNLMVRSVREFLGARDLGNPISVDGTTNIPTIHSVAGNPIRFSGDPLRVKPDTEWRSRLPRHDRFAVEALTFPLARHYYGSDWK